LGDLTVKKHRCLPDFDRVVAVLESDDYAGFCLACGAEAEGVEPDAREYPCPDCGAHAVYGAEEVLFILDTQ
jgi:predicted RNA-binding Zn-ribbon protein involved in translation (DUF1610 family)